MKSVLSAHENGAGHPQQQHETSHGSMAKTRWTIEGPENTVLELEGHKFGQNDDGAPMLCSLVCRNMGRHAHIDYCRSNDEGSCNHAETHHITDRMNPNPDRPKDWITHSLYWQRSGASASTWKNKRSYLLIICRI